MAGDPSHTIGLYTTHPARVFRACDSLRSRVVTTRAIDFPYMPDSARKCVAHIFTLAGGAGDTRCSVQNLLSARSNEWLRERMAARTNGRANGVVHQWRCRAEIVRTACPSPTFHG